MPRRFINDKRKATQIISEQKQAGIRREFPTEYLDSKPDKIYDDAENKSLAPLLRRKAKKARKLLDGKQYDK